MFKDNTVFVVGAGASQEFGLPIGWELVDIIRNNCNFVVEFNNLKQGSRPIFAHYLRIFGTQDATKVEELNLRLRVSRQIKDGIDSADSIDEYIFRYSHDPLIAEVGKLQIAYAISLAESASKLSLKKGFVENIDSAHNTWIWAFFKALINGVKANELDRIGQNITIICFNYDRCIEHYLEHALTKSFAGLSLDDARKIVKNINIIHPYGSLGGLDEFPFGLIDGFPRMAGNIVTWSETVRDLESVNNMRHAIWQAERIVFMGFAFANQNMKLLDCEAVETNENCPLVFSTGYGLQRETKKALSENINALYSNGEALGQLEKIHFQYDAKCKEFFDIHRINLVQ
ncbi:hypothetical protein [Ferirhizobium litorale]|uniref:SIR2-like domain-containing protein n=1 Tax=Ferirhizobium litorale TaxID=2927786 RepID=A0AAE3U281_9HYPH|nr:hypothetical protein [Fererhizobium litorale]MDI7920714.1 hypothetical protein [Fererhizobium litorale]